MSTWLKLLPLELADIDESKFIRPGQEMLSTDTVVGKMSDAVKQLWTLAKMMEKDARQSQLDAQYCIDNTEKIGLKDKANEYAIKSNAIKDLMWIAIKEEFNVWSKNLGIRSGFEIVTMPDDDIPPFIRRLMDGGL